MITYTIAQFPSKAEIRQLNTRRKKTSGKIAPHSNFCFQLCNIVAKIRSSRALLSTIKCTILRQTKLSEITLYF